MLKRLEWLTYKTRTYQNTARARNLYMLEKCNIEIEKNTRQLTTTVDVSSHVTPNITTHTEVTRKLRR